MISNKNRRGFTLVELLVVVGMIAVLLGSLSTSVSSARARARIQRATSDVKIISQAILSYETWNGDELPKLGSRGKAQNGADATAANLSFLIGNGNAKGAAGAGTPNELPVLLMAQLKGGRIVDPWGRPYKVTIAESAVGIKTETVNSTLNTGYYLPNFYRTTEGE